MISAAEYSAYDATGLAELIRSGEVSREEVGRAAVEAIAVADERLHPFAEGPWAEPLDAADRGVFGGVPFVLKDLACNAAGVPQHMGTRALSDGIVRDTDSELMARFRRAGLRTYGSVRIPEMALNCVTEPLLGGPTLNPWDPSRSPGGSAALVAAGAVPIAHANDGAGSIRIPASHTNTLGFKPSRGRVPIGPHLAEAFYGNVVEFAITRSVRDAAGLLDAVSGRLSGERYSALDPERPYASLLAGPDRPLRIGLAINGWSNASVDPEVAGVINDVAGRLESAGHRVEPVDPFIDWEEFLTAMTITYCAGTAADVYPLAEALGIGVDREHFEATTVTAAEAGRSMTPMDLARSASIGNATSRRLAGFMADYDVLMTPVAVEPPVPIGSYDADDASLGAESVVRRVLEPHPTCALYNVAGAPAVSIPGGMTSAGLPVGVQLGAAQFREDVLIEIAAQLEQMNPWIERRAPLHVANSVGSVPVGV